MSSESKTAVTVSGIDVDAQSRCAHWHSPLDVVAIKFRCCGQWYPCYDCHHALADHDARQWAAAEFTEEAIRCGACQSLLPIDEYLNSGSQCPHCEAHFNPGCAKHYDLYFEI